MILLQSSLKRSMICLAKSESTTCSTDSVLRRPLLLRLYVLLSPYSTHGCTTPHSNGSNNKDSSLRLSRISKKMQAELQISYCARTALVPRVKLLSISSAAPVNKCTIARWIARGIIGARVTKTSVSSFKQPRKSIEIRKNLQKRICEDSYI